jgi:hypothetical protein
VVGGGCGRGMGGVAERRRRAATRDGA